jgi:hypothetical protein
MELNEHTTSPFILSFKLLLKMFIRHPLKFFVSLIVMDACF